jgi:transposase-like protein
MQGTKTIWQERVASWRASGETAAKFSSRHDFAPTTLRYWASRLKRDAAGEAPAVTAPLVRLARVVRAPSRAVDDGHRRAVVVEILDARVRVLVEAGVARATLDAVFGALGVGGAQ